MTEPEYHRPKDGMNNVSAERMQTTLDVVGGAFAHNAMNRVDITSNKPNAAVKANCGEGTRDMGTTDANGALSDLRFPRAVCTISIGNASKAVSIVGDTPVSISAADGSANASVPAQLSLSLGTPAAFTPGLGKDYTPTSLLTYGNPTSNDAVTIGFKQTIGVNEPPRTGSYSKTLTFTLSTTAP